MNKFISADKLKGTAFCLLGIVSMTADSPNILGWFILAAILLPAAGVMVYVSNRLSAKTLPHLQRLRRPTHTAQLQNRLRRMGLSSAQVQTGTVPAVYTRANSGRVLRTKAASCRASAEAKQAHVI